MKHIMTNELQKVKASCRCFTSDLQLLSNSNNTDSGKKSYRTALKKYALYIHSKLSLTGYGEHKPPKKILVLTCIDYRFQNFVNKNVNNKYPDLFDLFIFAGVSVGYLTSLGYKPNGTAQHDKNAASGWCGKIKPLTNTEINVPSTYTEYIPYSFKNTQTTWQNVFNTHIALAIILHDIYEIHLIEHADCGAYKAWLGTGRYPSSDPGETDTDFWKNKNGDSRFMQQEYWHKQISIKSSKTIVKILKDMKAANNKQTVSAVRSFIIKKDGTMKHFKDDDIIDIPTHIPSS